MRKPRLAEGAAVPDTPDTAGNPTESDGVTGPVCHDCAQAHTRRQATTALTFLWVVTRWPAVPACDEHVATALQETPTITPTPISEPARCGRCSAPASVMYAPVSESHWVMHVCDEHAAQRLNSPPPEWCDRVVKGMVARPGITASIDTGWRTLRDARRIKLR
jgi:hypothetical protein